MNKNFLDEIIVTNKEGLSNYPFSLPLFSKGFSLKLSQPITFITGENGTGKSTFLENLAMQIGFNSLGGNKNHQYSDEKIRDNSDLANAIKLVWNRKTNDGFFFRAESFFRFANYIDDLAKENGEQIYGAYGGKSLQEQSHGESFLALFGNRFSRGLFILDEPEAALSPERQLSLIAILCDLTKNNDCQFIIATHSPILITCPGSELYEIENGVLTKKNYKDSKQFQLYSNFIKSPDRYLKYLLQDE